MNFFLTKNFQKDIYGIVFLLLYKHSGQPCNSDLVLVPTAVISDLNSGGRKAPYQRRVYSLSLSDQPTLQMLVTRDHPWLDVHS